MRLAVVQHRPHHGRAADAVPRANGNSGRVAQGKASEIGAIVRPVRDSRLGRASKIVLALWAIDPKQDVVKLVAAIFAFRHRFLLSVVLVLIAAGLGFT